MNSAIRLSIFVAFLVTAFWKSALIHRGAYVGSQPPAESTLPIKYIIVVVQENHSFDSYFGTYPKANGLNLVKGLPRSKDDEILVTPVESDNYTFTSVEATQAYNKYMDHGREDASGMVMLEYYDREDIPNYWEYADNFVLLDNLFSSVRIRYSVPSHLYIIAATSAGVMKNEAPKRPIYEKTIIDYLLANNVSWKYYSGQRTNRLAGISGEGTHLLWFQQHMNDKRVKERIVPVDTYFSDIKNGTLPKVSWVISTVENSEHPPYNIRQGMNFVTSVVNTLMKSKFWNESAVIVLWDDYGFFNDHVKPPVYDTVGPGPRVPGLIISPYAKKGFIDHSQYTTSSPLKLIETMFNLPSLTNRDRRSAPMLNAFDFKQSPRLPLILSPVPIEK